MKRFLAIYTGTEAAFERSGRKDLDEKAREARERAGMEAWMEWGRAHADAIVDQGTPLGRTKRTAKEGISDA